MERTRQTIYTRIYYFEYLKKYNHESESGFSKERYESIES